MKKKLLYALALSTVVGIGSMNAQLFIRDYNIVTTGVRQDKPVDVNYHASQDTYFSLHQSLRGNMSVLMYQGTTHANMNGANFTSSPAVLYDPQAIQHLGNNTYVLFNVPGTNPSFGIIGYDHTTTAYITPFNPPKNYTYPTTDFSVVTKDMMLDPNTKMMYIVGDITDKHTGRVSLYVGKLDITTAILTDHIYSNDKYDLHSNNIFVFNSDEIYIGAGATNPGDNFDRGAYILEINSSLLPVAQTIIYYEDACIRNQMTNACAKRYKETVYALCPSYINDDPKQRGDYFLATLDPALTTLGPYTVYDPKDFYFNNNVAPKFEFVNNFRTIMVSGTSVPQLSGNPGYVHASYDMGTTAFSPGYVYPNMNVGVNGNPIIDAYNINTDQVFTAAEDDNNAPTYYVLNSKSDGFISDECNKDFDQPQVDCRIFNKPLEVPNARLANKVLDLRTLLPARIKQDYQLQCGQDARALSTTIAAEDKGTWNVYPNPAASNIEIAYTSTINTIVITNIKGEKVRTFTNVNSLHMAIEINDLPKGMYFINAISSDNQSINKKFIKE